MGLGRGAMVSTLVMKFREELWGKGNFKVESSKPGDTKKNSGTLVMKYREELWGKGRAESSKSGDSRKKKSDISFHKTLFCDFCSFCH